MRIILILALSLGLVSPTVHANGRHHNNYHRHHHHHNHYGWIAPALIGGAVIYAITRPVVAAPEPRIVYVPHAPVGYHYESILDANCNCYRTVLVAD